MKVGAPAPSTRPGLAVALAGACVAFGLASEFTGLPWSDTLWLLHVAGRMLSGAQLYQDIIEINPPLIFWAGIAVVRLAHLLGIDPLTAWRLCVALSLLASAAATARLLRSWGALPWLAFALFVIPGRPVFGEREHLVLAALLPWLAAAYRRMQGWPAPAAAGLAAAIAFALKPHYAPIWLAVLWLESWRDGWRRSLRLPEHGVTAGALTLYALAVVVRTPEYFSVIRAAGDLYGAYVPPGGVAPVAHPSTWVALIALGFHVLVRSVDPARRTIADLLACLVAGSLLAVLLQGKGFWYHYYPLLAASSLLLASLRTTTSGLAAGLLVAGLMALRLPAAAGRSSADEVRDRAIIETLTEASPPPASVMVLDPSGDLTPFRYAYSAGVRWSPRWPFHWFLNLPPSRRTDSILMDELAAMSADASDLLLIRVTDRYNPVDMSRVLARFPLSDGIMRGYVEAPRAGHYRVFLRRDRRPTESR